MQVFVYGTLTDPEQVAALLGDGPGAYEFVGPAMLEGFQRVDGRYPTLLPGARVEGELLAVDEPALERLDRYEGVDRGLYVRVSVPKADGGSAAVYVGNPAQLGVAADGAWADEGSFGDAVRSYILRENTVVRSHE
ncbi:gamma-glutamylcyclotransferase family protein [Natronorubrum sp. FCH18a]|uniref:gamma-glutamylcyclotransferase family protein n=1 Tax=Natronorubrum sp. FCH18a TaxID=3447018 RepID=UPI003F5117E2